MNSCNLSSHLKSLYSPLLLKSSSSDSKKGSVSSMKSSNEKTGSASDSNETSFCCGLCGSLLDFRDGLTPRCKGSFCEATWVMWTWLTAWWSFSLWTVISEKTERKVVSYERWGHFRAGQLFQFTDRNQINPQNSLNYYSYQVWVALEYLKNCLLLLHSETLPVIFLLPF